MDNSELIVELRDKMVHISNLKRFDYFTDYARDYLFFICDNVPNLGKICDYLVGQNIIPIEKFGLMFFMSELRDVEISTDGQVKIISNKYSLIPDKKELRDKVLRAELQTIQDMRKEDLENIKKGRPIYEESTHPELLKCSEEDLYYMYKLHDAVVESLNAHNVEASFVTATSVLTIDGVRVTISKSQNTNPHYLLATVFRKPKKIWNYDEIYEVNSGPGDPSYSKDLNMKYYHAAHDVQEKVAKETGIKDFLIYNTKTVHVNKRYLL